MTVQDLCERLAANNEGFRCFEWPRFSLTTNELNQLCQALRDNRTVKRLCFEHMEVGSQVSCSVATVLAIHPTITILDFYEISIDNFLPFARAMTLNNAMTDLRFIGVQWSPNVVRGLNFILDSNAIRSLTLCYCDGYQGNEDVPPLSLARNKSLKFFQLNFAANSDIDSQAAQCLPEMIANNQGLKELEVDVSSTPDFSHEIVAGMLEAAVGHMSLEELSIQDENEASPTGTIHVERISGALSSILRVSSSLKSLDLSTLSALTSGTISLQEAANALRDNTTLEDLHLTFHVNNMHFLLNAICLNASLKACTISLVENDNGRSGVRAFIEPSTLVNNTILERLNLRGLGDDGIRAFVKSMPYLHSLKHMDVSLSKYTREKEKLLEEALWRNTTLLKVTQPTGGYGPEPSQEFRSKAQYLIELNKGGRKILGSPEDTVPPSLWSHILARSSKKPDVLYFFLQEKPDVLVTQNLIARNTRKRKREEISTDSS